jgi:DNA polymerase-3 subunit epsilon
MNLHLKNPLAFFDLETTGINVSRDRVVEISIVKVMPNGEQYTRTERINPGMPIPAETSLIHGIYDDDVKDKPLFKDIARDLAKFLEGCDLAGFNIIRFDVPMLVEEFLRAGQDFDISRRRLIDSQKIFHLMEKRTLGAAYQFYCQKTLHDAHSAEADTMASMEILMKQVQLYDGKAVVDNLGKTLGTICNDVETLHQLTLSNMVDLAGRIVYNDDGIECFNFGKHKGRAVLAVFKKEPAYYDWIQNADFPLDTKRKLTEIKLREFNQGR